MKFYARKSIKAGPFRFNVSKSGVGVSAGVPGFRVGTGPRGNYVIVGANGAYYRTSLSSRSAGTTLPNRLPMPPVSRSGWSPPATSAVIMEDVTGATPVELESTGPDDLIDQLNAAATRFRWGWPAVITSVILGLATMPYGWIVWILATPLVIWLFIRDSARRSVVLFYDVNDAPAAWFEAVTGWWPHLSASQRIWRIVQSGQVRTPYQHKTNAGASNLVQRVAAAATLTGPKQLLTNVSVPSITAGAMSIHFLPDRLLVKSGKRYSDVGYDQLSAFGGQTRFIEEPGQVPRDARQIDRTWQYVNVKGGPDRRFANNRELPVMLYGTLELLSAGGLDWRLQISRVDIAGNVASLLSAAPKPPQLQQ